jgi:hypothetical protein
MRHQNSYATPLILIVVGSCALACGRAGGSGASLAAEPDDNMGGPNSESRSAEPRTLSGSRAESIEAPEVDVSDAASALGTPQTLDAGAYFDGGTCINIDLSTYDRSCNRDSDCVLVSSSPCTTCMCCNASVSAHEQTRYQQDIARLPVAPWQVARCQCPAEPAHASCVQGQCSW